MTWTQHKCKSQHITHPLSNWWLNDYHLGAAAGKQVALDTEGVTQTVSKFSCFNFAMQTVIEYFYLHKSPGFLRPIQLCLTRAVNQEKTQTFRGEVVASALLSCDFSHSLRLLSYSQIAEHKVMLLIIQECLSDATSSHQFMHHNLIWPKMAKAASWAWNTLQLPIMSTTVSSTEIQMTWLSFDSSHVNEA